eukprot:CAMPEP_0175084380 /NCGR_PEP_ID=MMETSP0052_2-20121109/28010_1 /TAXON_ID=51329 ORGANISM="Polytomella parva, Strain SAG 63-3" /NCGR_SAMPLE_ID=MMETSP0052_2 /ASSEMBLY_ACC=CAM_ASM_000194 /LENGTH=147 /DNA_ID=CAMNT_0016356143 /DNA_START=267 /DNA_END=710 /DNA_ORIENTATION=-
MTAQRRHCVDVAFVFSSRFRLVLPPLVSSCPPLQKDQAVGLSPEESRETALDGGGRRGRGQAVGGTQRRTKRRAKSEKRKGSKALHTSRVRGKCLEDPLWQEDGPGIGPLVEGGSREGEGRLDPGFKVLIRGGAREQVGEEAFILRE